MYKMHTPYGPGARICPEEAMHHDLALEPTGIYIYSEPTQPHALDFALVP